MDLERLREIRKRRGLTQEEMAKKLGYKGKSGYCQLEKGVIKITLDKAKKISDILGVEIEALFFENKVHADRTQTHPNQNTA